MNLRVHRTPPETAAARAYGAALNFLYSATQKTTKKQRHLDTADAGKYALCKKNFPIRMTSQKREGNFKGGVF